MIPDQREGGETALTDGAQLKLLKPKGKETLIIKETTLERAGLWVCWLELYRFCRTHRAIALKLQ